MFLRTKNRKGISTVLTTLIILVASVVLGTGVVLYGTSMFQNQASSATLTNTGTQVWSVNSTIANNVSWGAVDLRNAGDKIITVDKIMVRGQQVPYGNWFADTNPTRVTTANFQAALAYTSTNSTGYLVSAGVLTGAACPATSPIKMDFDGAGALPQVCLQQQLSPVTLSPGAMAIVYFKIPNGVLTPVDAGSSADIGYYAGNVGSPTTIVVQAK